jgi:hypothetical protein
MDPMPLKHQLSRDILWCRKYGQLQIGLFTRKCEKEECFFLYVKTTLRKKASITFIDWKA